MKSAHAESVQKIISPKIPPLLPLPKGGNIPLFGKEGQEEIF
jgi:hypothetical protein